MKKKLTALFLALALCLSLCTVTAFAAVTLPYSFDFEANPFINGWTTIDGDGDGYDWKTDTNYGWEQGMGIDEGNCALSKSYDNVSGSRNANNWMFSPAIKIPAGGAIVSWYEKSQDANWLDSYTVYVSETNTSTDPSDMTEICAKHGAAGVPKSTTEPIETWTQKTVELSAKDYAGKTVYIAFQHQDKNKFYLKIDNFAVEALAATYNGSSLTGIIGLYWVTKWIGEKLTEASTMPYLAPIVKLAVPVSIAAILGRAIFHAISIVK